jgi:hypothetical protein
LPHRLLSSVRQLYDYRCGYCGVSETETGGELTVDHFHPSSASGSDDLDNLVYCCFRCNVFKADFFPTDTQLTAGHRLLHPLRDNVTQHIRFDAPSGMLFGISPTGSFHIGHLQLNRPHLVTTRMGRKTQSHLMIQVEILRAELEQIKKGVHARTDYKQHLANLWDSFR